MTKNNPLFIDSTKLHGDRIGTQIELCQVLIYDDETLLVVITDHQGGAHRVPLRLTEENTYQGRVWLGHQKTIGYYFMIEKSGRTLLRSPNYQGRAQYAVIENWEPVIGEVSTLDAPAPRLRLVSSDVPIPAGYVNAVSSLIDKWGL